MDSFILQKPNNVCNASRDKTHKNPLRQIGLCNEDRDRWINLRCFGENEYLMKEI